MSFKHYYNGKLVRTSKIHEYRYGVLNAEGVITSCHSTRENAEKELRRPIAENESNIEYSLNAIKAIEAGKKGIIVKVGRGRSYYNRFDANDTVEHHKEWIETYKARIERYRQSKIVELEVRG